jgi:hypothetical protein
VAAESLWAILVSCATAVCCITFCYTIYRINRMEYHMATQDDVNAVVDQLGKASAEIQGRIADLETQVANGEAPDLTALKAAAQRLDDVVPDPEPPVEENP